MKPPRPFIVITSLLALPSVAFAQEPQDPPNPHSTVAEKPTVRASDDVQKQVGLGTQKEESDPLKAQDDPNKPAPAATTEKGPGAGDEGDPDLGHLFQFGVKAGFVGGYSMSFRYETSPFCRRPTIVPETNLTDFPTGLRLEKAANKQQLICGFGAAPALDFALSFAVLDSIEPFAFFRMGLSAQSETDTDKLRVAGLGLRLYTRADEAFKLFFEPALGLEFEEGQGSSRYTTIPAQEDLKLDYKKDIFFHVAFGPQYDFARSVGIYAQLGMNVGVARSISATIEGQGGLQLRAP